MYIPSQVEVSVDNSTVNCEHLHIYKHIIVIIIAILINKIQIKTIDGPLHIQRLNVKYLNHPKSSYLTFGKYGR